MTPAEALSTLYRHAARSAHPDKGGDHESMKRVNEAKELLSLALSQSRAQVVIPRPPPETTAEDPVRKPPRQRCVDCSRFIDNGKFARCWNCFATQGKRKTN